MQTLDSCSCSRSTPVCACEANSVAMACLWRGQIRYRVRRTSYRTGISEINRDFTTRIVVGPAQFVKQMWRHLVLLDFSCLPHVSHKQGEHTRSQHAVYNLMKKAYQDYCTEEPGSPPLGLEDWCVQRRRASPQF